MEQDDWGLGVDERCDFSDGRGDANGHGCGQKGGSTTNHNLYSNASTEPMDVAKDESSVTAQEERGVSGLLSLGVS